MVDDYTELNDIEAGCGSVPLDFPDYEKGLALSAEYHQEQKYDTQYAYYRRIEMSKVCEEFLRSHPRENVSFRAYLAKKFGADIYDDYVYQRMSDEEVKWVHQ